MFHRQARLSHSRVRTVLTIFKIKVEISEAMFQVIVCTV